MRAEAPFLDELKRNKFLSPYLATDPKVDHRILDTRARNSTGKVIFQALEAIYLDTASSCMDTEAPSKVSRLCRSQRSFVSELSDGSQAKAATGLVDIIALYPQNTRFFLNLWTWGYEDIMKAIARSFGVKVSRFPELI